MKPTKIVRLAGKLAGFSSAFLLAAQATATTQIDLKVGFKTLPLLTNKLSGATQMAVLFDPAVASSKTEADSIVAAAGAGMDAPGGVSITAAAIPVDDLPKHADAKLVFVSAGLSKSWDAIQKNSVGALTLTTDLDCVKADKCIIGIMSAPSVTIYYSQTAADTGKISFSSAFAMLSKKF